MHRFAVILKMSEVTKLLAYCTLPFVM